MTPKRLFPSNGFAKSVQRFKMGLDNHARWGECMPSTMSPGQDKSSESEQSKSKDSRDRISVEKEVDRARGPQNESAGSANDTPTRRLQNNSPDRLIEKQPIHSCGEFSDNFLASAKNSATEAEHSSLVAEGCVALSSGDAAHSTTKKDSGKVRNIQTSFKQSEAEDATLDEVAEGLRRVRDSFSAKNHSLFDRLSPKDWSVSYLSKALKNVLALPSTFFGDPGLFLTGSTREKACYEFYRLSTFAKCEDVSVSIIRLAESGFYYDEELDDVLCFSCGVSKRSWSESEKKVALIHLELNGTCPQANCRDKRNVPVSANFPDVSSESNSDATRGEHSNAEIPETDGENTDTCAIYEANTYHEGAFDNDPASRQREFQSPRCGAAERNSESRRNEGSTAGCSTGRETTDAQGMRQAGVSHSLSYPPRHELNETRPQPSLQATAPVVVSTRTTLVAQTQQTLVSEAQNTLSREAQQTEGIETSQFRGAAENSPTPNPRGPKSSPEQSTATNVYRSPVQPTQAPYATPGNAGVHSSVEANSDGSSLELTGLLDMRCAACSANAMVSVRLSSFSDWPSRGLPSPRSLVIAGFYCMGAGDSVRCFYCGVTLRNWRENDDPWETHVRFRFSCDYVRAVKGEQFIHQTLVKLATGQCILSSSSETVPRNLEECTTSENAPSTTTGAASQTPNSTSSCDSPPPSQEIQTDSEQASSTSTATTDPATPRQNAGQPNATSTSQTASAAIPHATTSRQLSSTSNTTTLQTAAEATSHTTASREHSNTDNITTSQTASAVTSHTTTSREHPSTSNTTRVASSQDEVTYLQGLRETNQRLRQRVTCRLCRSRSVDTIFLPCGHLCTCELCAATVTDCCLCGNRIRGTAHVYME